MKILRWETLLLPHLTSVGLTTFDAKTPEAKYPEIAPVRARAGAPNVLVILIDEAGFGSSSVFGGPCATPNLEKLARNGLRFNRFHTTAVSSVTRQTLLTPLAEILKLNGYSTAQFDDLAGKTSTWIRQQKALMPDTPFFVNVTPGATHAPEEWVEQYKGKFDQGWDNVREETITRQKEIGVVPQDCELAARHEAIPAWDRVDPTMKSVFARQMERYAGSLSHLDHRIGQVIDSLADMKILNDTLIYVIIGDHGAADESRRGTFNHYADGWAHAMNAPYQWTKRIPSHFGGRRKGTIVHWPRGITAKGEIRSQFCHVVDVVPTVLEVAGLRQPTIVNRVEQQPIEGVSMAYAFNDAEAPDRHEAPYFDTSGNRGIYPQGWTAVTKHRAPWPVAKVPLPPPNADVWELYDTRTGTSQKISRRSILRSWPRSRVESNARPTRLQ